MQGIFISYRRQDSQSAAGRLADDIKDCLPGIAVFRDVETIEPGVDFSEAIARALQSCGVLLAVIGPRWLAAVDEDGRRRLDDADDYTRIEIATALKRSDVRVIPILVEGAQMPEAEALPDELRPLARRNALELTDGRWRYDVSRLAQTVAVALGATAPEPAPTGPTPNTRAAARGGATKLGKVALGAAVGAVLVAAIGVALWRAPAPVQPPVPAPAPASADADADPPNAAAGGRAKIGRCPRNLSINRELPSPFRCRCGPDATQRGMVWGSDPYTDDSELCRAALHAGAIPAGGGVVSVRREDGQPLYVGSVRNGVESYDFGQFGYSIRFQLMSRKD